jgi:hypothetical protein
MTSFEYTAMAWSQIFAIAWAASWVARPQSS